MAGSKNTSGMLVLIIALVVLIAIPVGILTGFYFVSDAFQLEANKVLSKVPGGIGEHFKAYPTREELGEQIEMIAEYALEIELEHAADKLDLIKKEDAGLYDAVVKSMIRLNPKRSELIIEVLRKRSLKPNVIASTVEEIQKEMDQSFASRAETLKSMSMGLRLEEIKRILDQEVDSHYVVANILTNLADNEALALLKRLDPADQGRILTFLPDDKQRLWNDLLNQDRIRQEGLDLAVGMLDQDSIEANVEKLGPNSIYTLDEKVYLFSRLAPEKAGRILSIINDDAMTAELIQKIKETQLVDVGSDKITDDILKALKIYREYDDNIIELADIYNGISEIKAAEMIRELYWKTSTFKSFTLSDGQSIIISSTDVAMDVLRQFDAKRVASILSLYDAQLATEISTQLALPRE